MLLSENDLIFYRVDTLNLLIDSENDHPSNTCVTYFISIFISYISFS